MTKRNTKAGKKIIVDMPKTYIMALHLTEGDIVRLDMDYFNRQGENVLWDIKTSRAVPIRDGVLGIVVESLEKFKPYYQPYMYTVKFGAVESTVSSHFLKLVHGSSMVCTFGGCKRMKAHMKISCNRCEKLMDQVIEVIDET